ncbi:WG repeat-containing protein [Tamlana flava]|uniref:WG repeat-containing protein n=1 Tax=Tamlana flava TaxID=3158572 RepID=UPI00351BBD50
MKVKIKPSKQIITTFFLLFILTAKGYAQEAVKPTNEDKALVRNHIKKVHRSVNGGYWFYVPGTYKEHQSCKDCEVIKLYDYYLVDKNLNKVIETPFYLNEFLYDQYAYGDSPFEGFYQMEYRPYMVWVWTNDKAVTAFPYRNDDYTRHSCCYALLNTKTGKLQTDFEFLEFRWENEEYGTIPVSTHDDNAHKDELQNPDKWGYINFDGQWVIEPKYFGADRFSEGFAQVTKCTDTLYAKHYTCRESAQAFINLKGELITGFDFSGAKPFSESMAVVSIRDPEENGVIKYGFIDTTGKQVIDFIYYDVNPFDLGAAKVYDGQEWFWIDKNGNKTEEPVYKID